MYNYEQENNINNFSRASIMLMTIFQDASTLSTIYIKELYLISLFLSISLSIDKVSLFLVNFLLK